MNHVFDVMSTIASQLNIISKDYNGTGTAHKLPKTPEFISASIDRMLNTVPGIIIDDNKDVTIDLVTRSGTGDVFSPLYICSVNNIRYAKVDRVAVIINHKNNSGPGIATIVIVPSSIFSTDDFDEDGIRKCFRDIYFGVLDNDVYMSYKASPSLVRLYNNPKISIPTYDIEMVIAAICCMNLNARAWFYNGADPVGPRFILKAFTDKELDAECKNRLVNVMKRCNSVSDVYDAIKNGRILNNFTDND